MRPVLSRKELNALRQADDIAGAAIEALGDGGGDSVALAWQAIAVSPLCSEAYQVLASFFAAGPAEAVQLWRSGYSAAEIVLADEFESYRGEFWGFIETRPYMRAKQGLVMALLAVDATDEAIGHLEEMLDLNPNDNQGMRYVLIEVLVAEGRNERAEAVLGKYPDDDAPWMSWSAALLAFRKSGDTAASRAVLTTAAEANPHVAAYLTGKRATPKRDPDFYSPGDRNEAVLYSRPAKPSWAKTPGALAWMETALKT